MEFAKFMFKFYNKLLPRTFDNYFTDLNYIHKYNTRQKIRNVFFHHQSKTENGKRRLHHKCLNVWKKIPPQFRTYSFGKFKQELRKEYIAKYNTITQ